MTQTYNLAVNKEIQNLLVNYKNRAIRASTDYQIVTIGRLQIENLDWKWEPEWATDMRVYMQWDPYDCKSVTPFNKFRGNFVITKYGISCRTDDLTLGSYKPLWQIGTKPEEQVNIMGQEMIRMQKQGSKKCENGIEIVPEMPLWNTVDTLTTKARNTFRTLLLEKVKYLESRGIKYDDGRLWNEGVMVTPEILTLLKKLNTQMTK